MGISDLVVIINKFNTVITNWLEKNNFKCAVCFSDHFLYDYLNLCISYTLFEDDVNNNLFIDICKSIYDYDYDLFTISFLHELGHHNTLNKITIADLDKLLEYSNILCPSEDDLLEYFVSFPEWEATAWACNYIKENEDSVKELKSSIELMKSEFFDIFNRGD